MSNYQIILKEGEETHTFDLPDFLKDKHSIPAYCTLFS